MTRFPRPAAFDSTLAFLADPYRFLSRTARELGSDVFEVRLGLSRTLCLTGKEGAELFCDNDRFSRRNAAPEALRATLLGQGGVQGLDGAAHHHRKAMFMSLMGGDSVARLGSILQDRWDEAAARWAARGVVALYPEMQEILCRAVCAWADVPLATGEVTARTRDLVSLFDDAGAKGLRHVRARLARRRVDAWLREIIGDVRIGKRVPTPGTAVSIIASHRDEEGQLLPLDVAAVELCNVLRPTVANAVYVTFAAHALVTNPKEAARVREGGVMEAEHFLEEVRRFYPFFPAAMARVKTSFDYAGRTFPHGARVLLDLYGIDHDDRIWAEADRFLPARFVDFRPTTYQLVPQGAGEHAKNHRCPGEFLTREILRVSLDMLATRLRYEVPATQSLQLDFARTPAMFAEGLLLDRVRFELPRSAVRGAFPGEKSSVGAQHVAA